MSGTKLGGLKTRETNLKKYGSDYYKRIGAIGGRKVTNTPKGFAANPELARLAGAKGGRKSKRGPSKNKKIKVVSEEEAKEIKVKKENNKGKFGWLFGKRK